MSHSRNNASNTFTVIVRWTARISATVSVGILTLFLFSHLVAGELKPDSSEAVGLLCFPVGVIAGLTLAFRFEMVGAVTAIVSLMAFHVWHFLRSSDWPGGIYFMLFTSPAALFLCSGWLQRRENRSVAASCQDTH